MFSSPFNLDNENLKNALSIPIISIIFSLVKMDLTSFNSIFWKSKIFSHNSEFSFIVSTINFFFSSVSELITDWDLEPTGFCGPSDKKLVKFDFIDSGNCSIGL